MNILEQIVASKKKEVDSKRLKVTISALETYPGFSRRGISLGDSLTDNEKTGIIAEFKRRSPSKGDINSDADVRSVTTAYTQGGASGLSVLTDEQFFGGSLQDLAVARQNDIPLLRKDFMIDEYQFYEAKAHGADVVLLIAACLTQKKIQTFSALSKQLELQVLLEIHNEQELGHLCDEVDFVGVNNRNLKTFTVDIRTSLDLIEKIPPSKPAIAESGISSIDTIVRLKEAGFRGFLIGENFMKNRDPGLAFSRFAGELKARCV